MEFTQIEGYPNYGVSREGRVKNLKTGRILKNNVEKWGYHVVVLCHNGMQKTHKVHKLVAMTYLGHTPDGHRLVVDHIDNDKTNNHVDNLQIISQRENISKDKQGEWPTGVSKGGNRYYAKAMINGKMVYLGGHETPELASEAYQTAIRNADK